MNLKRTTFPFARLQFLDLRPQLSSLVSRPARPMPAHHTIRPWAPPASLESPSPPSSSGGLASRRASTDDGRLSLEVLDVTSTAVALSVFTPSTSSSSTSAAAAAASAVPPSPSRSAQPAPTPAPSSAASKPPTISIQLDRRPWPHVAHAGSSSVDSLTSAGAARRGAETTVIVYGLDPGRDYEISLDVVGGEEGSEEQHHQASVEIETGAEAPRQGDDLESTPADFATNSSSAHAGPSSAPEGPPPPYSASLPPSPPNESQLRALLKKIRASSKRTESVLNASISALRKSVEKGMKEDQRARTRIVSLEEAIRKAEEGERESRTREMDACEDRIRELEELEEEVEEELERRKKGKGPAPPPPKVEVEPPPPPPEASQEEGGEEEEAHEGIADLAKELDALNKLIDEAEKETRKKAKDTLRALEQELSQIDAEIVQIDREEAHRYNMVAAAHRSTDSLDRVDPSRAPPPLPVQAAPNSGFNIRWRRNQPQSAPPIVPQPAPQQDPRSFGRFFRRASNTVEPTVPAATNPPPFAAPPSDRFIAQQQYAQAHQALWAPPNPSLPSVSGSNLAPRPAGYAGSLRRRSGSLNSGPSSATSTAFYGNPGAAASGSTTSLGKAAGNRVVSLPIAIPEPPADEEKKEKEGGKESTSASSGGSTIGASWGRIGTWSSVVKRKAAVDDKEKDVK